MEIRKIVAALAVAVLFSAQPLSAQQLEIKAPDSAQIGQPLVVEIFAPKQAVNFKISWQGKEAFLHSAPKESYQLCRTILGTDLKNAKPGSNVIRVSCEIDGIPWETEKKITLKKKDYPSEKLTVAPKMVNPPKDQMERIAKEGKLASAAIQTNTPGFAPRLPLVRPVPGILTSVYGKSRYFNNELRSRHGGIDMRAAVGTPIKSAADGKVVLTGDFWFAGKCVYIDHGAGLISFYGHMSKLQTEKGRTVKAGETIGLSGQTGRVTGPHLHFSLVWRGEYFDPEPLIAK